MEILKFIGGVVLIGGSILYGIATQFKIEHKEEESVRDFIKRKYGK